MPNKNINEINALATFHPREMSAFADAHWRGPKISNEIKGMCSL